MIDHLLIDECLSVSLVAAAKTRGFEADHVTHLGKAGWQDWNLMQLALKHDYVFVTNNRRDFLKLYAKTDVHNGLMIIIPVSNRANQIRLFNAVLDAFDARNDDLMNKLVEVLTDGSIHIRDWTSTDHDIGHIGNPKWP